MSTSVLGSGTFLDSFTPAKGKNEWGIDTLTRKMTGARSLLEAFIATLEQGQIYQGYFLQTWEPDDNPNVATITLNYKGLLTGGTPVPKARTEIAPAAGSISAVYTSENDGKGRIYKTAPLYSLSYGRPEAGIVFDEVIATRQIYTTGATLEFTYDAVQTNYHYIAQGKPFGPRYYQVDIPRVPVIKKARLTTADGSVYGIHAPSAFDDLIPDVLNRVVGFVSEPIIGTTFWECEDTVRRELGEGDSDTENTFAGN